jgi:hypothetical protein
MVILLLCFASASAGATIGALLGAGLAYGKVRDLETAYGSLAQVVRKFLDGYEAAAASLPPHMPEQLRELRRAVDWSDDLAGLRQTTPSFALRRRLG